jgi:hypothetical protein
MNRVTKFPIPMKSLRIVTGEKVGSYVIAAMFTASYSQKANRLIASCENLGLPYVVHEVPTVHRSISIRGTDDLSYTKANFIRHQLEAHKKPILYVDADCEFVSQPVLIDQLVKSDCDFAIHNGFASERTERFVPIELSLTPDEPPVRNRFYRFAGGERWYSKAQLVCSGAVQFYANSLSARALLLRWHGTIAAFTPGRADDSCLDFTFNNLSRRSWLSWLLKVHWLPKGYARYPMWIYAKPIINHPDWPSPSYFNSLKGEDPKGRKRFYPSLMEPRDPFSRFPPDCIIDTEQQVVCKLVDGQLVPIEPLDQSFWE